MVEDCLNGEDDDADGKRDCDDEDCWSPACGHRVEVRLGAASATKSIIWASHGSSQGVGRVVLERHQALTASAVLVIAPSPLVGEGCTIRQQIRLGEGSGRFSRRIPLTHFSSLKV